MITEAFLRNCLSFATELAYDAGAMAKAAFSLGMRKEWKEDNSPVTDADTAINDLAIARINARFPDHGIVGEEASAPLDGARFVWVCDPIDGTIPFAHGVPTSAFSLALCHDGVPQVAVAYDFHLDRMLTAVKGDGTTLNGAPVRVHASPTLRGTITDVEAIWMRGCYDALDLTHFPGGVEEAGGKLTKFSSTVYAGMLVAMGELAGIVTRGDKPWDVAAIALLVAEAGGMVTDLHGDDQPYDKYVKGCVLSNGILHATYLRLIADAAERARR